MLNYRFKSKKSGERPGPYLRFFSRENKLSEMLAEGMMYQKSARAAY
ncbi:hypothetical protein HMPREF0083_03818 [Aneurinibacillus aneurinilyticus ATCC 12856]|uniref:Uncharacterized protein n=1 Tax=Aneurinibacillus aneurinilyticus ATCC 12856 TaxID=649747 RepID=U1WHM7_ANEAE|nr:hypothetical protein HMPREF0083_03818 [Aneurinibacillus aneurinilyticus ATCC 12856]